MSKISMTMPLQTDSIKCNLIVETVKNNLAESDSKMIIESSISPTISDSMVSRVKTWTLWELLFATVHLVSPTCYKIL